MLQLIDKVKIYFYILLLFTLLSIHNLNSLSSINKFFKINKIILISNLEENLNQKIISSLEDFYNFNIFSLRSNEIISILENFNIINDYKIMKEYPSVIKIDLKKTNILAYYIENNQKIYIGDNGKKIKELQILNNDLPVIEGAFDIQKFQHLKNKLINNGFKLNDFIKFYYFESNRWDLIYKNNILIKLPINDLDLSLSLLNEIIQSSNINDIKVIDLRIKNRVILS